MPESRSRPKKTRTKRYQLEPQRKKPTTASPRWYGPMLLVVMAVGVAIIVLNYIGILLPGATNSGWLWGGLGVIGLGFLGTMYWR
jgi:hypothetical protein